MDGAVGVDAVREIVEAVLDERPSSATSKSVTAIAGIMTAILMAGGWWRSSDLLMEARALAKAEAQEVMGHHISAGPHHGAVTKSELELSNEVLRSDLRSLQDRLVHIESRLDTISDYLMTGSGK